MKDNPMFLATLILFSGISITLLILAGLKYNQIITIVLILAPAWYLIYCLFKNNNNE
jgi:hypothetical protein